MASFNTNAFLSYQIDFQTGIKAMIDIYENLIPDSVEHELYRIKKLRQLNEIREKNKHLTKISSKDMLKMIGSMDQLPSAETLEKAQQIGESMFASLLLCYAAPSFLVTFVQRRK